MSQATKFSKVTIRNRKDAEGKVSHGSNTVVEIDGIPVPGCTFVKIECKPTKMTKVVLEMYAEVDAETYANLPEAEPKKKGWKSKDGKHYAVHAVSSYEPVAIAETPGEET